MVCSLKTECTLLELRSSSSGGRRVSHSTARPQKDFCFGALLLGTGFYTTKANSGVNLMETFLDKIFAFLFLGIFVLALLGAIDYFYESINIFRKVLKRYKDRNRN